MQEDMHFYGTYAMALAAGIPYSDAQTIAYSAQFVDDSTKHDSSPHIDGGLLYGIATAHSDGQCIENARKDREEQRRVWVPFHFLPGGQGDTLQEKLICGKDSDIAREMMREHIDLSLKKDFGLQLVGIAAHTYMDTFSHYGFSGISSKYNAIDDYSLEPIAVKNPEMEHYILDKKGKFIKKFGLGNVVSFFAEKLTHNLGHGAVATFPDRPFLEWKFDFDEDRPEGGKGSNRNNRETFMEGCQKLHYFFSDFAKKKYPGSTQILFKEIQSSVEDVIAFEGAKEDRSNKWAEAELVPDDARYSDVLWELDKEKFSKYDRSEDGLKLPVYRFHQAAAYHRYYVLKDLLPKYGITVY